MTTSRSSSASSTLSGRSHHSKAKPMGRKSFARRCERCCCAVVSYFPLAFVYGLTTWAAWVQANLGWSELTSAAGRIPSCCAIIFYLLLTWCYSVAVFTPPGSPRDQSTGYSSLPTHDPARSDVQSLTVKSTGGHRFCKKCEFRKPDRTHHCSTCRQCVLKMDHHCPWLATCVGLRNYKSFLLFLIYTCVYCWICFGTTGWWLWMQALTEASFEDSLMPINYILLCVISGIIGLVLTGFTMWHVSLAVRGMTTIECLEKTRYLTSVRKTWQRYDAATEPSLGHQLAEIHANALPGVTRDEEGEVMLDDDKHSSRAANSLRQNYIDMERSREQDRYDDYLDEKDSDSLPSAFNLGWRRNLVHLFGEPPLLRFVPVCNTTGDGWRWEPSTQWLEARGALKRERHAQERGDQAFRYDENGWVDRAVPQHQVRHYFDPVERPASRGSITTLRRRESFDDEGVVQVSDDEGYDGARFDEERGWPAPASSARRADENKRD